MALIEAVGNLGTTGRDESETRRIQAFNFTAAAAFVLNTGFAVFFALVNIGAFLPLLVPNLLASTGYLVALVLNSRDRSMAALWLLAVTAWGNLTAVAVFFGFLADASSMST